jgi:glutamyl-tRNA synthetase
MVKLFDLEKVHVTAAKFDFKKLSWMNGEYIKSIEPQKFRDLLVEAASCSGNYKVPLRPDITTDESRLEWWNYLSSQIQIRTKALVNLDEPIKCFISDDYPFDEKAIEKRLKKPGVKPLLLDLVERFANAAQWKAADLEAVVKELSQGNGMGPWVHPIRVAVSGRGEGIGLFEMLELLGREKTLSRLKNAAENLASE